MTIEGEHLAEEPSTHYMNNCDRGAVVPRELTLSWDAAGWRLNITAADFALAPQTCRVWSLSPGLLLQQGSHLESLQSLLSEDERGRALAFRVPAPRVQFIVCRAVLRLMLSSLTGEPPQQCRLDYLEFGKPYLASPASDLSFNIAHSGEKALFAFGCSMDIGVDIEWHRPLKDVAGLATSIFGAADYLRWMELAPEHRLSALYIAWVRKEAVLKAIGKGLTLGLPELEVAFFPGEDIAVRGIQEPFGPAGRWSLISLAAGVDYSAAIAAPIAGLRVV